MDVFREISRTNAAYCASHGIDAVVYGGLSSDELNGRALSEPELERALVIDLDLARAVAEETRWLMRRGMSVGRAIRWAEVNVRTGVSNRPHAVIEYAMSEGRCAESMALFADALGKYYSACRQRGCATYVGD